MKYWAIGLGLLAGALLFYIFDLNHIAPQEIGIAYNSIDGEVTVQKHPGWYVSSPFVSVAAIDTRPFQVCLGAGARVLNCKLIRFKEEGAKEFVQLQGFRYWGSTSSSCISGSASDSVNHCYGMSNVLLGYAYSERPYPFLEVLEEIKPNAK